MSELQLKVGQVYRHPNGDYFRVEGHEGNRTRLEWLTGTIAGRRDSAVCMSPFTPVTWPEPGQVYEKAGVGHTRRVALCDGRHVTYRIVRLDGTDCEESCAGLEIWMNDIAYGWHLVAPQPAPATVGEVACGFRSCILRCLDGEIYCGEHIDAGVSEAPAQEPEIRVGQVWTSQGRWNRIRAVEPPYISSEYSHDQGTTWSHPIADTLSYFVDWIKRRNCVLQVPESAPAPVESPKVEPAPKPACVCRMAVCRECTDKVLADYRERQLMDLDDRGRKKQPRPSLPPYEGLRTGVGGIVGGLSQWRFGR